MKYRRIYQTLEQYGAKITYDGSGWRHTGPTSTHIDRIRPLWIVAEAEKAGLRLWVCHEAGRLSVTTADMTLSADSRRHRFHRHRAPLFRGARDRPTALRDESQPNGGDVLCGWGRPEP